MPLTTRRFLTKYCANSLLLPRTVPTRIVFFFFFLIYFLFIYFIFVLGSSSASLKLLKKLSVVMLYLLLRKGSMRFGQHILKSASLNWRSSSKCKNKDPMLRTYGVDASSRIRDLTFPLFVGHVLGEWAPSLCCKELLVHCK